MKISIAMATYNGAKYLQQQLDSFVAQTRQPDELVVCDDCSMDNTIEILKKFQKKSPFAVRVYNNEINLGYIKNFEKALSLCTGDIIFLSDQDDVWFKDKLEVIEKKFSKHPNKLVVINDQTITDENLNPTPFTKLENILSMGLPESWFVTGCCTSFRASWLSFVLPFPDNIAAHDIWITGLANAFEARIIHREPLQYYRRHNSNTSDSIASSQDGLSQLDIVRLYGLKDVRSGWLKETVNLGQYISRIQEINSVIDNTKLKLSAENSILDFKKKIAVLEQRITLMSKSRWRRIPEVIGFWHGGAYQYFSGWKSAVKDMLR